MELRSILSAPFAKLGDQAVPTSGARDVDRSLHGLDRRREVPGFALSRSQGVQGGGIIELGGLVDLGREGEGRFSVPHGGV